MKLQEILINVKDSIDRNMITIKWDSISLLHIGALVIYMRFFISKMNLSLKLENKDIFTVNLIKFINISTILNNLKINTQFTLKELNPGHLHIYLSQFWTIFFFFFFLTLQRRLDTSKWLMLCLIVKRKKREIERGEKEY